MKNNEKITIKNSTDKLIFNEAALPLISSGLKLATTKLVELNPIQSKQGDVVIAQCGEKNQFSVRIIAADDMLLSDLILPRLLLGSFTSQAEAIEKLGMFFNMKVTPQSRVRHYVFIPETKYASLSQKTQNILRTRPLHKLLILPELKEIFYPSMMHWLSEKLNYSNKEWKVFINKFSLLNSYKELPIKN